MSLDDYELLAPIGEGSFGAVWLAHHIGLQTKRAVKIIPPDGVDATAMYAEAQTMLALTHANVVPVYDTGRTPDGGLYIAMEYLPNGSAQSLRAAGRLPLREAIRVSEEACRGLEYVHQRGFIHRDVKPGNILIGPDGRGILSDFGLTARADARGGAAPIGYIRHLAPELLMFENATSRSDIYALGLTVYRLINGEDLLPNTDGTSVEDLILSGRYPDRTKYLPYVHRQLRTVVNRAMNVNPERRYASAAVFRQALEQEHPLMDWDWEEIELGYRWSGKGSRGTVEALVTRAGGRWDFTYRKAGASGAMRRIRALCASRLTLVELQRHEHEVLGKVSAA